jgi:hypothetical protein
MLSAFELLNPGRVTHGASLRRWNLDIRHILSRFVQIAVAYRTIHFVLAVPAQLPIGNDIGRDLFVTLNALLG